MHGYFSGLAYFPQDCQMLTARTDAKGTTLRFTGLSAENPAGPRRIASERDANLATISTSHEPKAGPGSATQGRWLNR